MLNGWTETFAFILFLCIIMMSQLCTLTSPSYDVLMNFRMLPALICRLGQLWGQPTSQLPPIDVLVWYRIAVSATFLPTVVDLVFFCSGHLGVSRLRNFSQVMSPQIVGCVRRQPAPQLLVLNNVAIKWTKYFGIADSATFPHNSKQDFWTHQSSSSFLQIILDSRLRDFPVKK